jgi:hypothetical protein
MKKLLFSALCVLSVVSLHAMEENKRKFLDAARTGDITTILNLYRHVTSADCQEALVLAQHGEYQNLCQILPSMVRVRAACEAPHQVAVNNSHSPIPNHAPTLSADIQMQDGRLTTQWSDEVNGPQQ